MKVVINESQKRLIIESLSDSIEGIKDECVSIFKKVLEDTKQQVNINLMMLSTWGFSVGGFLGPISLWLSNKNPQLSDMDISLILSGVICTLLYDNKDYLSKIVSKIKEKNLFVDFKDTVKKSLELKNVLFSFLKKHQDTIFELKTIFEEVIILLVCGKDGVAGIGFNELKLILDDEHEEVEWIKVDRTKNSLYGISGSNGKLNFKISKDDFLKKILKDDFIN